MLFISTLAIEAQSASVPSYSYSEMYMYDNQDNPINANQDPADSLISDPFILLNKHIFSFNSTLDTVFFSPIAETYLRTIPSRGRITINNFMSNIGEPLNFFNLLLQGRFKQARMSLGRFMTNSVLGCVGVIDVATTLKLNYKGEDFGQTLAHHKIPSGPYLVAPVLGPTSVRDLTGKVADFFMDPFKYALNKRERNVINVTWLVHKRAGANEVIKTVKNSLDSYETAKILYIQNRTSQIND